MELMRQKIRQLFWKWAQLAALGEGLAVRRPASLAFYNKSLVRSSTFYRDTQHLDFQSATCCCAQTGDPCSQTLGGKIPSLGRQEKRSTRDNRQLWPNTLHLVQPVRSPQEREVPQKGEERLHTFESPQVSLQGNHGRRPLRLSACTAQQLQPPRGRTCSSTSHSRAGAL